jgi:sialic acid synthase SpsE
MPQNRGKAIPGLEIVAEFSANHNGSLSRALDLVRAAARAGVDAIKLQTYTPDTITLDSDFSNFKVSSDHALDRKTPDFVHRRQLLGRSRHGG